MKFNTIAILTLIITSFVIGSSFGQVIAENNNEYVILFDESHGQYFNRTLMKTALEAINTTIKNVRFIFNNDTSFNSTNLQGINLVIIGNPGEYSKYNLSSSEIEALQDYVERGGSVFLLSNPLTSDNNITGHPSSFNNLLGARTNRLTTARISTQSGLPSEATVIMDDFNYLYNNESYVSIKDYSLNTTFLDENKLFSQTNMIKNITLFSTAISIDRSEEQYAIGRTNHTSYLMGADGSISQDMVEGFLTWLFAKQIGNSRLAISGSTIMFSDLNITSTMTFINEAQNKQLWLNIINWLLHITPYEEEKPIAIPFFELIIIAVVLAITSFIISIILYKYKQLKLKNLKIKK